MEYRKRLEHNEDNYIKAILESIVEYNAIARLDIANLLHIGYKDAIRHPEKHSSETVVLEILAKWMQCLEDLSVLLMMYEKQTTNEERIQIYMTYKNHDIYLFLHRVRKGLSKSAIMRIAGLKSTNTLYSENKINKSEVPHFKDIINKEISGHQNSMLSIAKAYVGNKIRKKPSIEPSLILDIYFKTKHSFKVIHPTPTAKKVWTFSNDDMHMLMQVKKWRWGRKTLPLTTFTKFKPKDVEVLVERIEQWSKLMSSFAELQLKAIDDPYWFIPYTRAIKTEELLKKIPRPSRNDVCLCGSDLKFKKCCESHL